jgi:hypothetical protein
VQQQGSGGSELASHMVSSQFVGTSRNGMIKMHNHERQNSETSRFRRSEILL